MTHVHNKEYSKKHDAYYCPECGKWLEYKCQDDSCEFCACRSDVPDGNENI